MCLFQTSILVLYVVISLCLCFTTAQTSRDSFQVDYPASDYYSEDYDFNYDNSAITAYANQVDEAEQNTDPGISSKTFEQGDQSLYKSQSDTDQYPIYDDYQDYQDYNSNIPIANDKSFASVLPKSFSDFLNSSTQNEAAEKVHTDFGYSNQQPDFNYLVKNVEVKHPFGYGVVTDDQGLGLSYNKELTLKGIAIAVVFVVIIYLFVALALESPVDLFHPKCEAWGWEGYPEWDFHAEPRFVPAIPVDSKMQLEYLKLFKGKKIEDKESEGSSSSEELSMEMHYGSDMSYISEMCPKDAFFYGMAPTHQNAWRALQRMFVAQSSPAEVLKLAKATRHNPKINQKVWYLGLLAASAERADMNGFAMPHPIDAFPDMFVPAHLIESWDMDRYRALGDENNTAKAFVNDKVKGGNGQTDKKNGKDKGKKGKKQKKKKGCVVVDGSIGVENGIENKLWYWREDMMANQHHLYWHQAFPVNATRHADRRAEVFFFMHRSLLARYNAERLSNGLDRTYELQIEYGNPILEGYNSYLADVNSRNYWTPRPPMTPLADIIHIHDPDFPQDIVLSEWQGLYWKFVKAIKTGKILTANHGLMAINYHKGITPLVNTAEASELSVNPLYYDGFGLHNSGHLILAFAKDPEFKKKIPVGVMGDAAVSLRDPSFFTYHTVIDNLFEKFKQRLPPYKIFGGEFPLLWKGVEIVEVEVIPEGDGPQNELKTFYSKTKYDLAPGVDGSVDTGGKTKICAVHLDHQPFQFKIIVDRKPCARSRSEKATVRISMAPRFDEKGERLALVEQRRLMFPMDAFQVHLKVGRNVITRRDKDSSLTHPWTKSLKELKEGADPSAAADYCGCGWPSHLYIPKGNPAGMAFDLFVMVTNFDEDFVPDDPRDLEIPETCTSAYIFCGIPRRKYPDARPMGYPFDRPPYQVPLRNCGHGHGLANTICRLLPAKHTRPVDTLEEYASSVSNMATISFGIKHIDQLIQKWKGYS